MIELFKVDKNNVELNMAELSKVQPFSALLELKYNNTKTHKEFEYLKDHAGLDRRRANREFTFVFFYCSMRSPIFKYQEQERYTKAVEYAGLHEGFKPSPELKKVMVEVEMLEEKTILSLTALKAARDMLNNLIAHIKIVDFNATDAGGKSLYDITKYSTFIKQLPDLNKALVELEIAVKEQSQTGERIKGGMKKGNRED